MSSPVEAVFVISEGRFDEWVVVAAYRDEAEAEAEVVRRLELNKADKAYYCEWKKVNVK